LSAWRFRRKKYNERAAKKNDAGRRPEDFEDEKRAL
jgi:hypothetical protein